MIQIEQIRPKAPPILHPTIRRNPFVNGRSGTGQRNDQRTGGPYTLSDISLISGARYRLKSLMKPGRNVPPIALRTRAIEAEWGPWNGSIRLFR